LQQLVLSDCKQYSQHTTDTTGLESDCDILPGRYDVCGIQYSGWRTGRMHMNGIRAEGKHATVVKERASSNDWHGPTQHTCYWVP